MAFFPPVREAALKPGSDASEALADFQFYNGRISKALETDGVNFHEVYARSFRIRIGARVTTFHTDKIHLGYYFVAPGKRPRIEEGVQHYDAIEIAREYFGTIAK